MTTSIDFRDFERKMMQVSEDFNDWLSFKEDPCFAPSLEPRYSSLSGGTYRMALSTQHSLDASLGDLSFVSISDDPATPDENDRGHSKKQVSWGQELVREYNVTRGDHPSCSKLPLTLDWEYGETTCRDIAASSSGTSREGPYQKPKRLSLEDRRLRLFGDMKENLQVFQNMDADLDALMKGLDECLKQCRLPSFSLPLMSPASLFTGRSCLDTCEDAPIVRWRRISC
jgi:hypothetical protein